MEDWCGTGVPLRQKLTAREERVLQMYCEGQHSKNIASILGISTRHLATTTCQARLKLGVESMEQACTVFALMQLHQKWIKNMYQQLTGACIGL